MKIILASASPRRKELLGYITKDFEVMVSNADESFRKGLTIQEQSKRIAYLKAKSVFDNTTGDRIVIGSDTLVLKNGEHFGKPKSEQEAFEMISRLQNDVHEVITSLCVIIEKDGEQTKFIAFGGDGGTYDIGLQSLSGAMERGHDMTYVCYDNGAYMNTGIQRSSATPRFADTTTSPAGSVIPGKMQSRKDLTLIMASHHLPYVAQSIAVANFKDLYEKSEKAIYTKGATFLNVLAPCPRGWGYPTEDLMKINKLAIDTCYWPLYEVVDGVFHITYKPAKKLPVEEFLRPQKRFKHMFKPGNEWMIEAFQAEVDKRWQEILDLEEITNKSAE